MMRLTERSGYPWIPVVTALIVLSVLGVRQWQMVGDLTSVPLDDAYIHYRFAENLARGRGFAFNPNEPTPGSTAPLWVLWLAAGTWGGLGPIFTSKMLGAIAFVTCVWLTARLAQQLTGNSMLALTVGVLAALSGRMIWAALSGMETLAFTALTLLVFWRRLDHPLDWRTSAILGLAALLRPEGSLLFGGLLLEAIVEALRRTRSLRQAAWRGLMGVIPFATLIAPYVLFALITAGSPLPNTFYANARELTSGQYLVRYIRYLWDDHAIVFMLAVWGGWVSWQERRFRRAWLVALWAMGFPIVSALVTPNLRHHGRYIIPLIPCYLLLGMVGLQAYLERTNHGRARRAGLLVVIAAVGVGLLDAWRWIQVYTADARDITQMHVAMGHWVQANVSRDATLALSDIGAIAYISDRRILDLVGLVTPDLLSVVSGKSVGLERDQAVFDYLARHRPEYVVIIPTWYPYLASAPGSHLTELHTVWLDHTPSVGGGDHLRAYRADWSWQDRCAPHWPVIGSQWSEFGLDGFDLSPGASVQASSVFTVTLRWRSLQPAGRFKVFVHLLDTSGQIAAQHDGEPVSDLWPTHLWRPGDVICDERPLALRSNLAAGRYTLRTGMYDAQTGTRLLIVGGSDGVTLGDVEVTP